MSAQEKDQSSGSTLSTSSNSTSSCSACMPPIPRIRYTIESAITAVKAMPIILENGKRVFGPPANYHGPRPTYRCELYITQVPRQVNELAFLTWLHRCGTIYEFRLMMDSGHSNRGYAFVRYTLELEAVAAYELLSFLYVDGERLSVYRSIGKNRLYVTNIPKQIPLSYLEVGFRKTFPEMLSCTAYASKAQGNQQNRGYAYIEFNDHESALQAKKRTTPGHVRMWGCDLKVQWAKPKYENDFGDNKRASKCPAKQRHPNDYCAKLRLMALSNNWHIPIVVYGNHFREAGVQYGGIILKHAGINELCFVVMEIAVTRIYDVHTLMCEVAVQLIERFKGLPKAHCLVRVISVTTAELLHTFTTLDDLENMEPYLTRYIVHVPSIHELAVAFELLAQFQSEEILKSYNRSFLTHDVTMPTLQLNDMNSQCEHFKFYCILPKFRNNLPLNHGFNNTEITLLLRNVYANNSDEAVAKQFRQRKFARNVPLLHLISQRQNTHDNYILQYVYYGRGYYHPDQQINTPPIWVNGYSYQQALFEPHCFE